ncbi:MULTISPECIES: hypothetical protein [unclassified Mesorhizobium]|uniref:hypothetical protein n=1 Tax=unclassified Mesorhizobium TaxID=325217 RepID=UPI0010922B3C|nr:MULTISPECIES: hypothetical protein [unclassified Mesorhizobium]TGP88937.1 hypothetical protein EN861_27140 [Mesorhizobium sp. M8A.F.Ca.ET.218.01.1.1]TGT16097.1 hypothetical protein EN856_26675 [Mesorhizobium sp. M8A.F.Ca.ET.213.01.1.1]
MTERLKTLSEASEILRLTNRGVAKLARQHGLCMVRGRTLLFSGADIEGIKDTLRVEPTSPRSASIKPGPSEYRLTKSLIELSRKKSVSPKAREIVLGRSGRK